MAWVVGLPDSQVVEVIDSFLSKCDFNCCCGCCAALRPRYKRLVDNIFPVNPQDGLVRSNMDKLTFYSMSSPEKLDRIGEYLAQRVSRDIHRRKIAFVVIAVEAMDQLLVACHAHSLNLFVESFLKTVQKLLETTEPTLQVLASQSFVKFANIEEDTPSYHRRYDFFVSKFASLCHSNHVEVDVRNRLRLAGLRGLQGVVRKTVSDDLVENIWEPVHMDKIVPSLLYNMQLSRVKVFNGGDSPEPTSEEHPETEGLSQSVDPAQLAENCLRELVGRASFGNIRSVIKPVFNHFDLHELWVPNDFAIYTFKVIMFSIQVQYSYAVVEILMSHLDTSSKSKAKVRTSMADVLSKIIAIAAGESVGPSVLEIINSLLKHLHQSIMIDINANDEEAVTDEKRYQESLINALAEFANHLPDYQKIEIMMFILGEIPGSGNGSAASQNGGFLNGSGELQLQHILLKCLYKVSVKYQTVNYTTTFPVSFLEPLLRMSQAADPEVRLMVQQILHSLLDRHNNYDKLQKPSVRPSELELSLEKCSRADLMFMKKHGSEILLSLSECLERTNSTIENIDAVHCTIALLCAELASDEVLFEVLRWSLATQDMALTNNMISPAHRSYMQVVTISVVSLIAYVMELSSLVEYVSQTVDARSQEAPYLLPGGWNASLEQIDDISPTCLLDQAAIVECLRAAGRDANGMIPLHGPYPASQRHSWAESSLKHPSSFTDLSLIHADLDSNNSSPGIVRRRGAEDVTFESLKRILAEPAETRRRAQLEKRQEICDSFRNKSFQQLVAESQAKADVLQDTLNRILSRLPATHCQPEATPTIAPATTFENFGSNYPDLFVY